MFFITGCMKMKKINFYLKKKQIVIDKTIIPLSKKYLEKARNNLITMNVLFELKDLKLKSKLKLHKEYNPDEWVVICGYYAMYSAALALVAKVGFRSKNHSATITILEEYFSKEHLTKEDLLIIKHALLQKDEIEKLSDAKQKREIAQYSITKQTTQRIADKIKSDAYYFVNKIEEILESIK